MATINLSADPLSDATNLLGIVKDIVGAFKLDPTVKAQIESQITLQNLQITSQELQGKIQVALAEIGVDLEEAKSTNWFIAGWRPFLGWIGGMAFGWDTLLQPVLVFFFAAIHHPVDPKLLMILSTSQVLSLLGILLGGQISRTVEKVTGTEGNRS